MKRTILACVLLCAGCSTFTVEADVSQQIAGRRHVTIEGRDVTHKPTARIAVSFEPRITETLSVPFGIEHGSYPHVRDRGEERAFVAVKWRPFANSSAP